MTTTLVEIVLSRSRDGLVLVICSHHSACRAFRQACAERDASASVVVDTLAGHLARLMRADSASSGAPPNFVLGGPQAGRAIVEISAQGMLDLTWPELVDGTVDLDVPYARRVTTLLDEATALITWLRRNRVSPSAFADACAVGAGEFYGEDVELARARLAEPDVVKRASRRAREAIRAAEEILREQRRAESDLGMLLARLYSEYLSAERDASIKSEADVIDGSLTWLTADAPSAQRLFRGCAAIVVDDAEDAEPALPEFLALARAAGVDDVVVGGREAAAIDHLDGRRACPSTLDANWKAPEFARSPAQPPRGRRFTDESAESEWIAEKVTGLLQDGVPPGDIAVLARDDDAAEVYSRLLARQGVPVVPPSSRFADPDAIEDLLALARICDDPFDQARLLRVLASPLAGLSDASLWTLCRDATPDRQLALEIDDVQPARGGWRKPGATRLADNMLTGAADSALPEERRHIVGRLRQRLEKWRSVCAQTSPAEALLYLAAEAGFISHWRQSSPFMARRVEDDVLRLAAAVDAAWSSGSPRTLAQTIAAVEDGVVVPAPAARVEGAVACEGVIAVKGIRFAHVFVAGVARERFPRVYVPRALAFSRTLGLMVRENVAAGSSQTAKFAWYYAKYDAKRRYLEGERRVLAYAASRGTVSATVTGFGTAPFWAPDEDLLARYIHVTP